MRISHKHHFVFLAYPRTASTAIREILEDYSEIKSVHITRTANDFPFYHHISAKQLKTIFDARGWDWFAYKRFCVVRNPYDRVVSLYHHYQRREDRESAERGLVHSLRFYIRSKIRSYSSFKAYVLRINPMRGLAMSLKEFISDNDCLLVDDVLKFEELHIELPQYLSNLGVPMNLDQIPRLNVTHDRMPYIEYYDEQTRERVEKLYAYEIGRFGYRFGP